MFTTSILPQYMHALVVFNLACAAGRRQVNGSRPNDVISCMCIGYVSKIKTKDLAPMLRITDKACYKRMVHLRKMGLVTFSPDEYHVLTEQGQKVYDAAIAVMNTELPALVKWLAAEARKENKKADLAA